MTREQLRMTLSEAAGNYLLENVHRVVLGTKNLEKAREHLTNGGSLLVYANHFSKLDTILYARILSEYLISFNHIAAIGSRRHLDPNHGILSKVQHALGEDWEKIYGISIFQVTQTKDHEEYEDWAQFDSRSMRQAAKRLKQPGNVIFITPEGTRSDSGELLQAEDGFITLFRLGGKNVFALPLAAIHKIILPGRQTTVIAGEPFSYQDLEQDHLANPQTGLTDLAMIKLAKLLPKQNRGFYR